MRALRWPGLSFVLSGVLFASATAWAQQPALAQGSSGMTGRGLVQQYCTRCHLEPDPADLPKEYWPAALHWMSHYVGFRGDEFPDFKEVELPADQQFMGDHSVVFSVTDPAGRSRPVQIFKAFMLKTDNPPMSPADWALMREYFVSNARPADQMHIRRPKAPLLKGFTPTYPALDLAPNGLIFSLLVDEPRHRLYVGRGDERPPHPEDGKLTLSYGGELVAYDLQTQKKIASMRMETDTRDLELTATGVRVSLHGAMPFVPDNPLGKVFDWELNGNQSRVRMLANGFTRISQIHTRDLNGDDLDDLVVTSFGDGILSIGGGLFSVLWQTPKYAKLYKNAPADIPVGSLNGAWRETVLMQRAGMIGSAVGDFNNDGKPDIMLLTAQAQQQLILFVNLGNRKFAEHVIMERTPSNGHLTLEAGDFDNDGNLDVIVMNGNNVEMVAPRPQHGIRIFRNNGNLSFTERFTYLMHGASRAVLEDFDGDGDLDVAAIAIWPDWEAKEPESFVYLENKGNWEFAPSSLDSGHWGVWTHIVAGDVNGDGKKDIVLGFGNFRGFLPEDWKTREIMKGRNEEVPSIMYLLNKD